MGTQFDQNLIGAGRTIIATQHFLSFERLILAITDDDVLTFSQLGLPLHEIVKFELEGGFNVLNLAIDQERISIVRHLAKITADDLELRDRLIEHRHGRDQICAIHQAVTIGNRLLL